MLYVKTKVLSSRIHGRGLFADEPIPEGSLVWRFTPGFDLRFTEEQMRTFPERLQSYLDSYSWHSKKSGLYCFASDDAKYFNHSPSPNCLSAYQDEEEEVVTTTLRAIEKGEELTEDYGAFEKYFQEGCF